MPTKSSTATQSTDFVLKHRVAGAAFLLFFGALALPWLLGPPNQSSNDNGKKTTSAQASTSNDPAGIKNQVNDIGQRLKSVQDVTSGQKSFQQQNGDSIENELLNSIDDELLATQETVYISKITPADGKKDRFRDRVDEQVIDSSEKPLSLNNEAAKKPESSTIPESDGKAPASELIRNSTVAKQNVEDKAPVAALVKPQTTPKAAVDKIDVGWVVQVGVFTDKDGASKVVEDLQIKGFKPSITIVDTNRGKATGSRVWLGPFAQRVDAAKTKTRLTERTGEPGFIRAYP